MDLGVGLPTYCDKSGSVSGSTIQQYAKRAEGYGFAGLWAMDHLVHPDPYEKTVLDPLVALSHASAVTEHIPLGTSILLLPIRQTAISASQVATLSTLSQREVTLGLGAGYVPKEFEVTGVSMESRGARMDEGIEVLQRLFGGESSFDGEFHSFENVRVDPVPEEPPRLLAGGNIPDDRQRLPPWIVNRAMAADGWIAPPISPTIAATAAEHLIGTAADRDESADSIDLVALNYIHLSDSDDPRAEQRDAFDSFFSQPQGFDRARQQCLVGSTNSISENLRVYENAGFDQVILCPVVSELDALVRQLDLMADHLLGYPTSES